VINRQEVDMSRRLSDPELDALHEQAAILGADSILALIDEVRCRRHRKHWRTSGGRHVHR
jgi:hypothetical protein